MKIQKWWQWLLLGLGCVAGIGLILIIIGIAIVQFYFSSATVQKIIIEQIEKNLGIRAEIETVRFHWWRGIQIANLRLTNPAGFDDPYCFTVKLVQLDYRLSALFKAKLMIHEIRILGPKLFFSQNQKGNWNYAAFFSRQIAPQLEASQKKKVASAPPSLSFSIPFLTLGLNRFAIEDFEYHCQGQDVLHFQGLDILLEDVVVKSDQAFQINLKIRCKDQLVFRRIFPDGKHLEITSKIKIETQFKTRSLWSWDAGGDLILEPLRAEWTGSRPKTDFSGKIHVQFAMRAEKPPRIIFSTQTTFSDCMIRSESRSSSPFNIVFALQGSIRPLLEPILGLDTLRLDSLRLAINGKSWIEANLRMSDLPRTGQLYLRVQNSQIPMKFITEIGKPFIPGLLMDGTASLSGTEVMGRLLSEKKDSPALLTVSVQGKLNDFQVQWPEYHFRLEGFSDTLQAEIQLKNFTSVVKGILHNKTRFERLRYEGIQDVPLNIDGFDQSLTVNIHEDWLKQSGNLKTKIGDFVSGNFSNNMEWHLTGSLKDLNVQGQLSIKNILPAKFFKKIPIDLTTDLQAEYNILSLKNIAAQWQIKNRSLLVKMKKDLLPLPDLPIEGEARLALLWDPNQKIQEADLILQRLTCKVGKFFESSFNGEIRNAGAESIRFTMDSTVIRFHRLTQYLPEHLKQRFYQPYLEGTAKTLFSFSGRLNAQRENQDSLLLGIPLEGTLRAGFEMKDIFGGAEEIKLRFEGLHSKNELTLMLGEEGLNLSGGGRFELGQFNKADLLVFPLGRTQGGYGFHLSDSNRLLLDSLFVNIAPLHTQIRADGQVLNLLKNPLPEFNVHFELTAADTQRIIRNQYWQGAVRGGLSFNSVSTEEKQVEMDGLIEFDHFNAGMEGLMKIQMINGSLHFNQRLDWNTLSLIPPDTTLSALELFQVFSYDQFETYKSETKKITIDRIQVSALGREYPINQILIDLDYQDNLLHIKRYYLEFLGGNMDGSLWVKLNRESLSDPQAMLKSVHYEFTNQLSNIRVDLLTPEIKEKGTQDIEDYQLSSSMRFKGRGVPTSLKNLKNFDLEGDYIIYKISPQLAPKLFDLIDPRHENVSIQSAKYWVEKLGYTLKTSEFYLKHGNISLNCHFSKPWYNIVKLNNPFTLIKNQDLGTMITTMGSSFK